MTGFIPPADFRFKNNGFQMVRVRGKEIPGSLAILAESDPDASRGGYRISFRSAPVDRGDTVEVVGVASYVVTHVYDPYKTNPDRSMRGRFVAVIANLKGA